MTGFTQNLPVQRITAVLIGLWRQKYITHLTAVTILVVRVTQTLHSVAVCPIFTRDYQLSTHAALWCIFPVIILQTVNLPNFSLCKSLLSDWLSACCAHKTGRVIGSFQSSNHMIFNNITTCPARFETGLITVLTQRNTRFIIVKFGSKRCVALSALKACGVITAVQGVDGGFRQQNWFTAESAYIDGLRICNVVQFIACRGCCCHQSAHLRRGVCWLRVWEVTGFMLVGWRRQSTEVTGCRRRRGWVTSNNICTGFDPGASVCVFQPVGGSSGCGLCWGDGGSGSGV